MSNLFDGQVRHTHVIVYDSPLTKKIAIPDGWRRFDVASEDELVTVMNRAIAADCRSLLIVSDDLFVGCLGTIKRKARQDAIHRFGCLVIADDIDSFLTANCGFPELLDVVATKEARRSLDLHLLRVLRQLVRAEERAGARIGHKMLERLNEIFIDLSSERNPQRLLATILVKSMGLTNAEGGTLYMTEEKDGELYFVLKISNDRSNEITLQHINTKVAENSLSGYVALTAKQFNVPNLENLSPVSLPQYNRATDFAHSLKTVSLITVPFKNSRNELIGVLQLANKKEEEGQGQVPGEYIQFDAADESLLASFSTQAAICIENTDLYVDIQRLFDGFVKASISAIESRDPSTGGHSERVAKMCVALARATTEVDTGIYRSVKFKEEEVRELEYAALLHDFGKIGVREEVLVKAKKLYPYQLEAIRERIQICKAAAKINYLERRVKIGTNDTAWEKEYNERQKELESYWHIILQANEPSVLKKENREILERIRSEQLLLPDGSNILLVSEDEFKALSVQRGSLTESERLEVESHVRHTYQFLKMIPWTRDFRHLTEIAYCHHEKLDGTGYPRGLSSHEIPLQSKIMTIADIYDALTAADRWYKEAVPTEKAIAILREEVTEGKLDPILFEIFIEKKVYESTQPKTLTQVA